EASTGAGVALLPPAVLLNEHRHVETHQGSHIRRELAVTGCDQNDFMNIRDARVHVHDTWIEAPRLAIDTLEPGHALLVGQPSARVRGKVECVAHFGLPRPHLLVPPLHGDGPRSARSFLERAQHNLIGIGKPGLFPRERPYTDSLLDTGAAILDN